MDQVRAVDGVSFDVAEDTLSLVGESGSGRATTGCCILQLLKPTGGEIHFDGKELTTLGREDLRRMRREMPIVFPETPYASLDPRMTVGDIVSEPLVVHGIGNRRDRRDRVRYLLDVVGFNPTFTNRYPHEFSGGQRQQHRHRRARARAQSQADRLRRAGVRLDVSIQAQILNLLKDLQRDFNLTYLFIAHDLAVVRSMSDRIAVNRGKIVEIGPAEEIYGTPKEEYTKALLAAVPVPDPQRMKGNARPSGASTRACAGRAGPGLFASLTLPALVLVLAACGGRRRLRSPPRRLRRGWERSRLDAAAQVVRRRGAGRPLRLRGRRHGGAIPADRSPQLPASRRRAGCWTACRSLPEPTRAAAAAAVDGIVYVVQGDDAGREHAGRLGLGREGMAAEGTPAIGALRHAAVAVGGRI